MKRSEYRSAKKKAVKAAKNAPIFVKLKQLERLGPSRANLGIKLIGDVSRRMWQVNQAEKKGGAKAAMQKRREILKDIFQNVWKEQVRFNAKKLGLSEANVVKQFPYGTFRNFAEDVIKKERGADWLHLFYSKAYPKKK